MRPYDELTEQEAWFELACSCANCGRRRDPLPEVPELWLCPRCHHECTDASDEPGYETPCSVCGRWPEAPREKCPPAPGSGSVID